MDINSRPEYKAIHIIYMAQINELGKFRVPIGNQEIELQQIDHVEGGMSMLRTRIREAKRFTIFDVDSITARHWAKIMTDWADSQEQSGK
ncbi:MAG: hypothetical protein WCI39_03980 [Gallionellaceae bacterium]